MARQESLKDGNFFWNASCTLCFFACLVSPHFLPRSQDFLNLAGEHSFKTLGGQILQGMLGIGCFILVGVAFLRFGWTIALFDLLLVIIGSNVGLALQKSGCLDNSLSEKRFMPYRKVFMGFLRAYGSAEVKRTRSIQLSSGA